MTTLSYMYVQAPEEVICLVPELCSMTGLTDVARQDYKIMKVTRGNGEMGVVSEVLLSCRTLLSTPELLLARGKSVSGNLWIGLINAPRCV